MVALTALSGPVWGPIALRPSAGLRRRFDNLEHRRGQGRNAAVKYPLDIAQQSGFIARHQ
jgi:hypothetical protein